MFFEKQNRTKRGRNAFKNGVPPSCFFGFSKEKQMRRCHISKPRTLPAQSCCCLRAYVCVCCLVCFAFCSVFSVAFCSLLFLLYVPRCALCEPCPVPLIGYVMLCYVILCYVMLCYVMLCYDMLCYVMLCYVMLCYVMLCYVM